MGLDRDGQADTANHLSLSRLNHLWPWSPAYPEVVQGTAEFSHERADTLLPPTAPLFDDAPTRDPAVARLEPQPTLGERLGGPCRLPGQLLAAGLRGRPEDWHLRKRAGQEAARQGAGGASTRRYAGTRPA
jgi:hypothetical protein